MEFILLLSHKFPQQPKKSLSQKIVKSDKFKFNNELLANKLGGEIGVK
jgi:hypothetical protein